MSKIGSSGKPPVPQQAQEIQQSNQTQNAQSPSADALATNPVPAAAESAAALAQSQINEQRVGLDAKKKGFFDSLKDEASRKAGNLGVLGQFAAGQIGETASALGGAAISKATGKTVAISQIEKQYGKAVAADFKVARESVKKELKALEHQQKTAKGHYLSPDDGERLKRLQLVNTAFKNEPIVIAREIAANLNDPAYQYMGPTQFVSMEVVTRQALASNEAERGRRAGMTGPLSYGLSTMERVALYGYTTKEYVVINGGLRQGNLNPQLQAYVGHINRGMERLDSFKPRDGQNLYRGATWASMPQFVKDQYKAGGQLRDLAFTSTSTDQTAAFSAGDVKMTISGAVGKGKVAPFSAFPGEGEVLFPPGTLFDVIQNTVPDERLGGKTSPKAWDIRVR
jgi:NAD:arginine ADP-ribosyltransferase.